LGKIAALFLGELFFHVSCRRRQRHPPTPKRFRTNKRPHIKLDFESTNVNNIASPFYFIVAHFIDDFVVQVL